MENNMPSSQPFITFLSNQVMRLNERLNIQIDGKNIGDIGNNEELQIPVSTGFHEITSRGYWREKAIPLEIEIRGFEEIEITIEPASSKNKYQFYVEPKIDSASLLEEYDLYDRRLAWDMRREIFLRKMDDCCIYFDLNNHCFLHPLRIEIDIQNQNMKVFANRKQKLILYESRVDLVETFNESENRIVSSKKHSFYREDGTLLGYMLHEGDDWIITSADLDEKVAKICLFNASGEMFINQDNIILSLDNENKILAYKKWIRKNVLQIQDVEIPKAEYHEILTLAFITFCALSWELAAATG